LGALIVLGVGGWLVVRGDMEIGTLVAFNAYITFVFPPIVRFVELTTVFQRANTAMENIFALLDTQPDVGDGPGARRLPPVRGEVTFQDVCFDYNLESPGAGRP